MALHEFAVKAARGLAKGTPRNVVTGTSYTATGILPKPSGSDAESGSSIGVRIPELVPELASPYQRRVIYSQMMNDSSCDVSMRAVKTPVLGAEFYVEPHSGEQVDVDAADFICDNLFEGLHMPFLAVLEDILHFCEDGNSVVEKVYENREWSPDGAGRNTKTYTMLKALAYRPSSTISSIVYDNNGYLKELTQAAIQADGSVSEKTLPADKLIVFTMNRQGGDITGKSLLRSAYAHWYYKTHLYKVDAIQKERHSMGIPHGKLLPGYTAADKTALRTMLRNLRANEESFALTTPNIELEFLEVKGQLVDVLKSADHHNMMIFLNIMAAFLALGTGDGSGSRAVGATQSDMFMKSLKYLANLICDQINMHLIPELIVWNFPITNFPKLKVRNIGETQDLQKLSSAISNLFAQSAITGDQDTENYIRNLFDMPAKQVDAAAQVPTTDPNAPPAQAASNEKGSVAINGVNNGSGNNPKAAIGAN